MTSMWDMRAILAAITMAMGCGGGGGEGSRPLDGDFAEGGEPGQHRGVVTLDEYDWFAVEPYLGVIEIDLQTGAKRRLLSGRFPSVHESGDVVFAQPCGDRVSRVGIQGGDGLIEIVTPCSSEIEAPGYSSPFFGIARLSPDREHVAAELLFYVDWDYDVATVVYETGGDMVAWFDDLHSPTWTPDGRLVMAGEGLFIANRRLTEATSIDDGRLNAGVANPDVHPDGERVVFEYNQQIWEIGLDGSDLGERVFGSRRLRFPTWGPDGDTIVYLGVSQSDYYDQALYFTDLRREESTFLDLRPTLEYATSIVPNGPLTWQ